MNKLEKAAAFGSMMGKMALFGRKFTPDRKLQQALLAEREKLIAEWEEGGTDWSQETHPDTGGNPDFDRRWSKAFNEKKEVEPRVIKGIPYPLYGSKPSWFPFRTQGMIDKAREADYVRGDNEDAWEENDWKTERALQNDRTREGVNNILNHYLDRHHGIVKNPYRHPADLEYIDGPHADYKGIVQKSLPWNALADTDKVNELADETMFPDYKSPANRQKLFDQYYPYLDLAPSAKPSKKGPIAKAAAFGAMMGKRASLVKKADRFHSYENGDTRWKYGNPSLKAPASLSANQVQANEQLQGNVPIPGVQEGPAGKNRDMARMQHFQGAANTDVANLKPNTLAAERSAQQKDSDGKAISTVSSMLPFSRLASAPLSRAPLARTPSPVAAAKSPATPSFDPMKTILPSGYSPSRNAFSNSGRGSIKPPTPPMPSMQASPKPLTGEAQVTGEAQGWRPPYPATDAMRQDGWKFSPPPPVGKSFSKLPNQ